MRTQLTLGTMLLLAGVPGCSDTVNGGDGGPRPTPTGLEIQQDGVPIVTVTEDVVEGGIVMPAGQATARLQVVFRDALGTPLTPAPDEALAVEVLDPGIAAWIADGPTLFTGRFGGFGAGVTGALIRLLRGPDRQVVYTSPLVPITVTP